MKKILSIILIGCLAFSMVGCSSNDTEISILENGNSITKKDYGNSVRLHAVNLYTLNENNFGFSVANTGSDKLKSDYIETAFNEIGLKNVQRVPVSFDSWSQEDIYLRFNCDCEDEGILTIRRMGIYPVNFNFNGSENTLIYVNSGTPSDYAGKDVEGKAILLSQGEDLETQLKEAISHNPAMIFYCLDGVSGHVNSYSVDVPMFERLNTSIPVFSLSKSSYNLLRRYINEDGLSITMHGNNNIESKSETSDFIIGEIEGKNKNKIVYVTAHRDAVVSNFMGSCVTVGELLAIANDLVLDNYKPDCTIRFMVTTGHEWGKLGYGENIGIQNYLESLPELGKIKSVLVMDGNVPLDFTINLETQSSNEKLRTKINDFADEYSSLTSNSRFTHIINPFDNSESSRNTEGVAWDKNGIPVVLMSEDSTSKYREIEGGSEDNNTLITDFDMIDYVIGYYEGILKIMCDESY